MKQQPLTILLIEDDEDDYLITSELLTEMMGNGYKPVWVSRYSDALPAILARDYDVCLVDYRLGEGDGISLIRDARSRGCSAPMILLTGQGDADVDISAADAPAPSERQTDVLYVGASEIRERDDNQLVRCVTLKRC